MPVGSSSTYLGVNTQRDVDSCPHAGLSVLVGCATSSCFSWLRVSWSNLVRFSISSFSPHAGLSVLDNVFFGFGWIRWVSLLLLWIRFFHPINLKENLWMRPRWHIYFLVYKGWLRSILFDRTSILSVEQAVSRPSTPYLGWCLFHFFWYDARRGLVRSSSCGSLWFLCMGFTDVKNTVCLSLLEFCPPAINPEFVECKLTAHPTW